MRKLLSYRNIAAVLFVFTFFIFVLAQQYTRQNGVEQRNQLVSGALQTDSTQAVDQPIPAAIIVR
ncbi:MAG: hypothetical protein BGO52_22885 [Sphingobacteriales bacterium 44-61]|nr:MAG: hypothetical protein BGO52_22885 [Sphingobacteriales bacterium 44-61]